METAKKLKLLEEVFEAEDGTLTDDMDLDSIDIWDSMTKLSLIVMVEEEFGKILSSDKIRSFKTVGDIVGYLDNE